MEPIELGELKIYPVILPVSHYLKSYNCYLVEHEHTLYLIDAGIHSDDSWDLLNYTLRTYGFNLKDLNGIYITHHHIDHIGLINRIVEDVTIPVYAHKKAIPRLKRDPEFLQKRIDFFRNLYEEMDCGAAGEEQVNKLKKAYVDNKHLAVKADITPLEQHITPFTVIEVPGHSPDQVAFYHEKSQTLFGGDLLINHISSNALIEPDENWTRIHSLLVQMESLKKCSTIPLNYIFSGHGTGIDQPQQLIETRFANVEMKANKILSLIHDGTTTANAIAKQYYKKTYELQFSLVMSEIIGHLDYLVVNNMVKKEKVNGVLHYIPC